MNAKYTGTGMDGTVGGPEDGWWFNQKTGEVERGQQSLASSRIGPFATEAEAQDALETLRQRSRAWADEEDAER